MHLKPTDMEGFKLAYNGTVINIHPMDCSPGQVFRLPINWPRDFDAEAALVASGVKVAAVEVQYDMDFDCSDERETAKQQEKGVQVILLFGPFV